MSDTALKLADELSTDYYADVRVTAAADELRRLHSECEALKADAGAVNDALGVLDLCMAVEQIKALREANEVFGKRQEWWNDKMVALEAINAELVEALRRCRAMVGHPDNIAWIDEALAKVEGEGK